MIIRKIEPQDYESIVELIAEFVEESLGEYGVYIEAKRINSVFFSMYETSFVLVINDRVEGILGGRLVNDLCSELLVYEEVIWYVRKQNRKYGMKLFSFVLDWCYSNGIKRMTMCCMHNSKTQTLFDLYERLGFRKMETRFIKELDT